MSLMDKMERKLGKHAIPHLTMFIIVTYITGYVLTILGAVRGVNIMVYLRFYPPYILQGQVWRLVSWILIPPTSSIDFWTLLMLFCIYQQGTMLERVWGDFKFNFYIFSGLIMTLISGFITYALVGGAAGTGYQVGYLNTYYISLSVFLGLALTYPEMEFRFMFLIPIKAKYLVAFYGAYMLYIILTSGTPILAAMIIASAVNMALFFWQLKKSPRMSRQQRQTRRNFNQQMNRNNGWDGARTQNRSAQNRGPASGEKVDRTTFGAGNTNRTASGHTKIAVHRCAVCGRTELDDPNLEFRFCSKCNGNYEYCQDHLYTHTHVQ